MEVVPKPNSWPQQPLQPQVVAQQKLPTSFTVIGLDIPFYDILCTCLKVLAAMALIYFIIAIAVMGFLLFLTLIGLTAIAR
jgi:hypothetical protein